MGKKKSDCQDRGACGFESYYSEIFGTRWNLLKEALQKETSPVPYKISESSKTYFLDSASIFAAYSLPLKNAEEILDLCAAPGGKTLVLSSLMEKNASLTCNERSFDRKMRLVKVCDECMPEDIRRRVKITCSDGALWCRTKTECFDRILLDVPCSSERHVLNDEKYLNQWSPARIKTLSIEQWALLSSAYRMLKKDGILLYSTCALSHKENDDVIERLLKKFDDAEIIFLDSEFYIQNKNDVERVKEFSPQFSLIHPERTQFGYHILPDMQNGAGPIFFSIIRKKK